MLVFVRSDLSMLRAHYASGVGCLVEMLKASIAPGAVVADVARKLDVATSLIYKWRREHAVEIQPAFLPAMVVGPPSRTEPSGENGGAIVVHLADVGWVVIDAKAAAVVSATLKALRR